MNLEGWYTDTVTLEEQTGTSDAGDPTWGNRQTVGCRVERSNILKNKFQRVEREGVSRISLGVEVNRRGTYRFWLSEDDEADNDEANIPAAIQVVYDKWNRFVHTVFWF